MRRRDRRSRRDDPDVAAALLALRRGEEIDPARQRELDRSLERAEWSHNFDLDIILDTIAGREDWSQPLSGLPEQLPPGVSWVAALPQILAWVDEVDDIEPVLKAMQLRRSRSLFPTARRRER